MDAPIEESSPSVEAPNWSEIQRDILCPLCEYNLRGLARQRCPECGHQFVWTDVLTQGDRILGFLFEHREDRPIWSFFRTLLANVWSLKFWRTLLPTHLLVMKRLVIYWLVLLVASVLIMTPPLIYETRQVYTSFQRLRAGWVANLLANQNDPTYAQRIKQHGSAQAAIDAQSPMPSLYRLMFVNSWYGHYYFGSAVMFSLLWPWMTVASLLAFRGTLAQARIRPAHLVRCAVYSQAPVLLFVPLAVLLTWQFAPRSRFFPVGVWSFNWSAGLITHGAFWVLLVMTLLLIWRLIVACRLYLRLPHAVAIAVASQILVALAMFKVHLMCLGF
jgi:hypothetical protein